MSCYKSRAEHDRASCYNELNNTRAAIDQVAREKVTHPYGMCNAWGDA